MHISLFSTNLLVAFYSGKTLFTDCIVCILVFSDGDIKQRQNTNRRKYHMKIVDWNHGISHNKGIRARWTNYELKVPC